MNGLSCVFFCIASLLESLSRYQNFCGIPNDDAMPSPCIPKLVPLIIYSLPCLGPVVVIPSKDWKAKCQITATSRVRVSEFSQEHPLHWGINISSTGTPIAKKLLKKLICDQVASRFRINTNISTTIELQWKSLSIS